MLISGITPYPLPASPPWENFMQLSIDIVKSFIPLSLFVHNCCEEYEDSDQDTAGSNESCKDEDHEEEEDSLGELMELVKSLSAKIERLESEQSVEDSPVLETDVLDNPTDGDSIEYFITVEALLSTPDVHVVSDLNEEIMVYSDEEQKCPTSHFDDSGRSQPVYDSYESVFELDL
jgi:hypothetical protein